MNNGYFYDSAFFISSFSLSWFSLSLEGFAIIFKHKNWKSKINRDICTEIAVFNAKNTFNDAIRFLSIKFHIKNIFYSCPNLVEDFNNHSK